MIGITFSAYNLTFTTSQKYSAKSDENRGERTESDLQMCVARPEQRAG